MAGRTHPNPDDVLSVMITGGSDTLTQPNRRTDTGLRAGTWIGVAPNPTEPMEGEPLSGFSLGCYGLLIEDTPNGQRGPVRTSGLDYGLVEAAYPVGTTLFTGSTAGRLEEPPPGVKCYAQLQEASTGPGDRPLLTLSNLPDLDSTGAGG